MLHFASPVLPSLHIFGVEIRTYPIAVVGAVVTCWLLLLRRTARLGYSSQQILLWVGLAFPVGAVGGRALELFNVVAFHRASAHDMSGMTVIGAFAACVLFSRFYVPWAFHESPWRLLDSVSFTFPLSMGLGRLGCLLNGCCFGLPVAGADWGPPLTIGSGSYAQGTAAMQVVPAGVRVWNLPLLLALECALTLVIVEVFFRSHIRERFRSGATLALAVVADAGLRLAIEPLRAAPIWVARNLSASQLWLWLSLVLGTVAFVRCRGRIGDADDIGRKYRTM
jgi:prolipoprotein diacylglyceryltransferase